MADITATFHWLLTVLQVLLAAGTVLTPLYYERFSVFVRRARHAVEEIEYVENHDVATGLSTISKNETGYSELLTVLKDNGHVAEKMNKDGVTETIDIVEIGHAYGTQQRLANFFEREPLFFGSVESIIYTRGHTSFEGYKDMKSIVLRDSVTSLRPGEHGIGEQMVQSIMYEWISDTAQERANRFTAAIVVFWTTLLFIN